MKSKLTGFLVIVALIGISLQMVAAAQKSFWEDEAWTATIVKNDFHTVIQKTTADRNPPLYFLLASIWGRYFGYIELALRSFSIVFIIVIYLLVILLTRSVYDDRTAWIAALLLTFSPVMLMYGHNARYYSLSAAFSLIVVLSTYKYLSTIRWKFLITYTIGGVMLVYISYAAIGILLACNLWFLLWLKKLRLRSSLLHWLIAQGVIILFYLPMVPIVQSVSQKNIAISIININWILELIKRGAYLSYAFMVGEAVSPLNPLAWVSIIVVGFVIVNIIKKRNFHCNIPLLILLVSGFINIIISIVAVFPVSAWQGLPNRTFFAYPFFVIWLACGISNLKTKLLVVFLGALLLAYSVGIFNYFTNRQFIKPILIVPWREIMDEILVESGTNTAVICSRGDYSCPYYVNRFGLNAYRPKDWTELIEEGRPEVWWIQINFGTNVFGESAPPQINSIEEIYYPYLNVKVLNYAQQDPTIRWIKSIIMNMRDYEYRISVYKFDNVLKQ